MNEFYFDNSLKNLFTHSPIDLFTFEINVPSPIFKTHKKKVYYVKKG